MEDKEVGEFWCNSIPNHHDLHPRRFTGEQVQQLIRKLVDERVKYELRDYIPTRECRATAYEMVLRDYGINTKDWPQCQK